jgi:hypothetical protein
MASEAEVRRALAWETDHNAPPEKNVWEWLWEAIQGDFNDNRSTGQIAFDAGISMIPVVDQICDVRDIIANCKGIAQSEEKDDNSWKWVALVLTLIGLFPSLGSLVKGVLKIFFAFVRRIGLNHVIKATDNAMTWVVTFLRKREVQQELRRLKVDEVFSWLAKEIKAVSGKINTAALLASFDRAIKTMKGLLEKVTWLPGGVGKKAQAAIDQVQSVRKLADKHVGEALKPVQDILDHIIRRLEMEGLVQCSGILNVSNVHFRGTLPEAQAVALMRRTEPLPAWMSKGRPGKWAQLNPTDAEVVRELAKVKAVAIAEAKGKAKKLGVAEADVPVDHWCNLTPGNIASFHKLRADVIRGPTKLYRVGSPGSGAMGDCWVSEEVFQKIIKSPDPKTAWRKYLAVWPDWNANGQFVTYELKKGEELKVWRGEASSQVRKEIDNNLEGGWEQIIFKPTNTNGAQYDTMKMYQRTGNSAELKPKPITFAEYRGLPPSKKHAYEVMRDEIKDPRIRGPFDTKWGSTDFDVQLQKAKIGLPALPGQVTKK